MGQPVEITRTEHSSAELRQIASRLRDGASSPLTGSLAEAAAWQIFGVRS